MNLWLMQLKNKKLIKPLLYTACILILTLNWIIIKNKTITLNNQKLQNIKLLAWMQNVDYKLDKLDTKNPTRLSKLDTPTKIQNIAKQFKLNNNFKKIELNTKNKISLSLTDINFDKFILFLSKLQNDTQISIKKISIIKTNRPGIVNTNVLLAT